MSGGHGSGVFMVMQVTSPVSLSLCCFLNFYPPPNENKISCWLVLGNVGNYCLQKRSSVLIHLGAAPAPLQAALPEQVLWLCGNNAARKHQKMK